MKDFALDSNSRLFARSGYGLRFTENISEYVAQKIRLRLAMFRGEWYLDNTVGVPYLDGILEKNPDQSYVEAEMKVEIRSIQEVLEITSFSIQNIDSTREMKISLEVTTSAGTVSVEV